ncbi:MAG: DUF2092 domain-containing protein [Phycisphaerae bacterium]|nr:DUF2092 domain-containing protein [Phycisphaerales bacterium]
MIKYTMFARNCLLGSLAIGLSPMHVLAEEPSPKPMEEAAAEVVAAIPQIDALADKRMREMSDLLGKLKSFRFSVEIVNDNVEPDGQKIQIGRRSRVEVKRPNGLRVESQGDRGWNKMSVFDGKHFLLHDRGEKVYSIIDAPGTLDEFFQYLFEKYGTSPPLVDFLLDDVHGALTEGADSGALLGDAFVAEKACDHLVFSNDDLEWQIWIEKGPNPLPRKFVITYKDVDVRPQYMAVFREWDTNASLDDARFATTAPADATSVPFERFVDRRSEGDGADQEGDDHGGANHEEADHDAADHGDADHDDADHGAETEN